LIAAYRNVGARWADLDPLKRAERDNIPELDPAFLGLQMLTRDCVLLLLCRHWKL
jgi:2-oxoglutarate dehydrogenase E1 component